jgi:hypothetical protein
MNWLRTLREDRRIRTAQRERATRQLAQEKQQQLDDARCANDFIIGLHICPGDINAYREAYGPAEFLPLEGRAKHVWVHLGREQVGARFQWRDCHLAVSSKEECSKELSVQEVLAWRAQGLVGIVSAHLFSSEISRVSWYGMPVLRATERTDDCAEHSCGQYGDGI